MHLSINDNNTLLFKFLSYHILYLILYNIDRTKNIGEMSFRSEVKAIKLKGDRIVVVLELKIFVYNFSDLKLVDHIETC